MDIVTKACRTCEDKTPKPISEFHKHPGTTDGFRHECKECRKKMLKEWRCANPSVVQIYNRRHRKNSAVVSPSRTREAQTEYRKKRKSDFPDRVAMEKRSYHLREAYGITPEQYNRMLMDQRMQCAICPRLHKKGSPLHVDHDHSNGNVRKLLCRHCNTMIGYARETPQILDDAASYLRKYQASLQIGEELLVW